MAALESNAKPDSVSAAVSLLFRRLKLPVGTSPHSLCHTHTSHLLASGVPLPAVSARLGHSSVRTTQEIYAHMITGHGVGEVLERWRLATVERWRTAPRRLKTPWALIRQHHGTNLLPCIHRR